ncbi:unnamed protein product [Nesidiocoris tenuis]|uniref:Small ribosomal subunit protein mS25 n=2 Tax=Nesidiocoris tenuis TaxID=355587 RepID=A0A6H5HEX1_9HEMI|nr:Mitochondrial ribosomal protein S25 [Nesidiocoris tenuis]CAB0014852.1 unnamed protein product [Nesidiocoris tenuis]
MPFMKGPAPIRRTIKFLEAGRLYLKDRVKIFSFNYNTKGVHHEGARDFAFWYIPQVQYKNPDVQVITFKNMTPTPFIKCYMESGDHMLIDVFDKTKEEIMDHLVRVLGKTAEQLKQEDTEGYKRNPALFGYECRRHCICEIPGQVPCPRIIPLPKPMRGKYMYYKKDEL